MPLSRFTAAPRGRILMPVAPLLPGLLTAGFAVGVAFTVHALVPALPAMTLAVLLGLLSANFPGSGPGNRAGPGRAWTSPGSTSCAPG
ncbi:conserved hypothetical protein [Arthrobacter sp. Hiyo6]|nr:conserved hypothetical protein [Arthrobacter sp. Hiyo6]